MLQWDLSQKSGILLQIRIQRAALTLLPSLQGYSQDAHDRHSFGLALSMVSTNPDVLLIELLSPCVAVRLLVSASCNISHFSTWIAFVFHIGLVARLCRTGVRSKASGLSQKENSSKLRIRQHECAATAIIGDALS